MKNLISLLCQLIAVILGLAFFFSLGNYFFGWHLGLKGQEVPADWRAALMFLGIAAVLGGLGYILGREKKVAETPTLPTTDHTGQ
jgi:hypothetical protein